MMVHIQEAEDEKNMKKQILYLLHIRKIGEAPREDTTLAAELKALQNNFSSFTMNFRVLQVLIQSQYIRQTLEKSEYPKFLITVL